MHACAHTHTEIHTNIYIQTQIYTKIHTHKHIQTNTHTRRNTYKYIHRGFPGGSENKASACKAGDLGSIPGSGRSPGEGNGNPLPSTCLENSMDGGAWWATAHRVAKSWTRLSDFTFDIHTNKYTQTTHTHTHKYTETCIH